MLDYLGLSSFSILRRNLLRRLCERDLQISPVVAISLLLFLSFFCFCSHSTLHVAPRSKFYLTVTKMCVRAERVGHHSIEGNERGVGTNVSTPVVHTHAPLSPEGAELIPTLCAPRDFAWNVTLPYTGLLHVTERNPTLRRRSRFGLQPIPQTKCTGKAAHVTVFTWCLIRPQCTCSK